MGTAASSTDEWIELENKTDQDIDLRGWTLRAQDGTPSIALSRVLPRHGFYLLERTDDSTVGDITADQIYTGSLSDGGESLVLRDAAGETIDTANGSGGPWPAGNGNSHSTMEWVNPSTSYQDANWRTNDGVRRNGRDAKGAPLNGTPKAGNSCTNPPVALFTFRNRPGCALVHGGFRRPVDRSGWPCRHLDVGLRGRINLARPEPCTPVPIRGSLRRHAARAR